MDTLEQPSGYGKQPPSVGATGTGDPMIDKSYTGQIATLRDELAQAQRERDEFKRLHREAEAALGVAWRERDDYASRLREATEHQDVLRIDHRKAEQERDDARARTAEVIERELAALGMVAALFGSFAKVDALLDQVTDSHGSRRAPTLNEAQEAVVLLSDALTLGMPAAAHSHDAAIRRDERAKAFRDAAAAIGVRSDLASLECVALLDLMAVNAERGAGVDVADLVPPAQEGEAR